ncbi:hypothetical protein [Variovorax sp. 160MFSha2.1]|uniref:hypothetical protein n=1 Tax=Variovorax sp. 160MFSha2.1 TaxID=3158367 RepID=UPI003AAF297F
MDISTLEKTWRLLSPAQMSAHPNALAWAGSARHAGILDERARGPGPGAHAPARLAIGAGSCLPASHARN